MGAFTSVTVVGSNRDATGLKSLIVTAVCPASYDAGGSAIDLSTSTLGVLDGFTTVYGGHLLKAVHTTPANSIKYHASVITGAAGDTPKVVVRDADAGTAMAQVSGDQSAVTLTLQFFGV